MLSSVVGDCFLQHGDVLRSVVIVFDYYGALNDADVNHAIWQGPQGTVTTPDGVVGSISSTMKYLEIAMRRLYQLRGLIAEELLQTEKKLLEVQHQAQAQEAQAGGSEDPGPAGELRAGAD
jgi:hypothetical protein